VEKRGSGDLLSTLLLADHPKPEATALAVEAIDS
jgi:hypothetical protein